MDDSSDWLKKKLDNQGEGINSRRKIQRKSLQIQSPDPIAAKITPNPKKNPPCSQKATGRVKLFVRKG